MRRHLAAYPHLLSLFQHRSSAPEPLPALGTAPAVEERFLSEFEYRGGSCRGCRCKKSEDFVPRRGTSRIQFLPFRALPFEGQTCSERIPMLSFHRRCS